MKIWLEKSYCYYEECSVKIGMGWYKHSPKHRWKGITIEFFLFYHLFQINIVSNFKAYKAVVIGRRKFS